MWTVFARNIELFLFWVHFERRRKHEYKFSKINLKNLPKLKRLNLSFNKLESIPNVSLATGTSQLEYMDLSYNDIDTIETESNHFRQMICEN